MTFWSPAISKQIGYESARVYLFLYFYLQIAWVSLWWARSQLLEGGGRYQCVYCCGFDLAFSCHGHFTAVLLRLYSSEICKRRSPLLASGYELLCKINCICLLVCLNVRLPFTMYYFKICKIMYELWITKDCIYLDKYWSLLLW